MKLITIVGARPQFVKAAAVSRRIQSAGKIEEIIIHTGQHFDENMSDIFFKEMDIPRPHHNLEINSLNHGAMTGRMLEKLEELFIIIDPDMVMVYGDTNSTLAGALTAVKLHIPVAHVEAGLRSFNMAMPEEVNRILTDRISSLLFAPTETAVKNLDKEGYGNIDCRIVNSGDVMYDAALHYAEKSAETSDVLDRLKLKAGEYMLCTMHRAENTDNLNSLKSIISALNNLNRETKIIWPIHPRTEKILKKQGLETEVQLSYPVGYFDMIELIKGSTMVITDSGGLQKEAYFFKKKCLTLREETEWTELVENGFNLLTGPDRDRIIASYRQFRDQEPDFSVQLYGSGDAAGRIVDELSKA